MSYIINSWMQPQNEKWRWAIDSGNAAQINVVPARNVKDASLAKAFACMTKVLAQFSQQQSRKILIEQGTQDSLEKLRTLASQRYTNYCNTHNFFVRIIEIFLSIFPGRTSTWMEHRRLLKQINICTGREVDSTSPSLSAFRIVGPLKKYIDVEGEPAFTTLQVPCRIVGVVTIKDASGTNYHVMDHNQNNRIQFDQTYSNSANNPYRFWDLLIRCIQSLPLYTKGMQTNGEMEVSFELVCFSKKTDGTHIQVVIDTLRMQPPSDKFKLIDRDPGGYTVQDQTTWEGLRRGLPNAFKFKHMNLPETLLDANGNLLSREQARNLAQQ